MSEYLKMNMMTNHVEIIRAGAAFAHAHGLSLEKCVVPAIIFQHILREVGLSYRISRYPGILIDPLTNDVFSSNEVAADVGSVHCGVPLEVSADAAKVEFVELTINSKTKGYTDDEYEKTLTQNKFTPGRILSPSEAREALESGFIIKRVNCDTQDTYHQWLWVNENGQLLSQVLIEELGMSTYWSKKWCRLSGEFAVCDDEFCKTPQEHALNKKRKEELLEYWAKMKFGFP